MFSLNNILTQFISSKTISWMSDQRGQRLPSELKLNMKDHDLATGGGLFVNICSGSKALPAVIGLHAVG